MRIGIDIRYLSHGLVGGVHTYLRTLLPELLKQSSEHQLFLYADRKSPLELDALPANATLRLLPYRSALSSITHDLSIPRIMSADRLDVAHFPANYGFAPRFAAAVITLHDEINLLPLGKILSGHPKDARTQVTMTYLHFCTRAAVRRASLIITVSEYARGQILRYSGFPEERVVAIPHAPTPDLCRVDDAAALAEVRARYGITRPFVLADGLKNPAVLVRAWQRLPEPLRSQWQIVFFTRRPDPLPVVREARDAGIAAWLVNPPRADLIKLFSQAGIFVFPSWIEGFGLPVLEAMTCGAPVIASDRGSLPEVVGGAGLIIDAEDDAALAEKLERWLTHPEERARYQKMGYQRAAQFSWQRTAGQVLQAYRQATGL